jgi:Na+/melibiose symporter-like transporter
LFPVLHERATLVLPLFSGPKKSNRAMKRYSLTSLFAYGLFGLPLALVALPIYVFVPQFYSVRFGLSLTLVGAALLAARILDAFIDPALGWWIDRHKGAHGYGIFILFSLPSLAVGFIALFHPPALVAKGALIWFMGSLLVVYFGFSLASIAHQSWGAALTQAMSERARVTAMREGCGLIGVVMAAGLSGWLGLDWLTAIFLAALALSVTLLLTKAARPAAAVSQHDGPSALVEPALMEPFRNSRFRWLFAVLMANGIAASIPATLFLFFVKDRLQLASYAGLFLAVYFIAAAASMPIWVKLAQRFGEARAWLIAMLLSALVFVWACCVPAGAALTFGIICVLSGLALGADLALPPALLAGVIASAGHSGQREGAYFGAWNWATKMNLALAAGISLPLLEWLGYVPNSVDPGGIQALAIGYAVVPCCLKLLAAAILWRAPLRDL